MRIPFQAVLLVMLAAGAGICALPAQAHHGWSAYDATKAIKVEARIEAVSYQMPHGSIEITYEGKPWVVVLAPPPRMQARGLPQDDLTVGKTVVVEAYPKRDGEMEMRAERITVDGKTIELR